MNVFSSCALLGVMLYGILGSAPRPPEQPQTGPGGKDYVHAKVVESKVSHGREQFWLFEPDQPKPEVAPVIAFLHGWGAMDPRAYRAWIDHLVRRGNIVIYPRYQGSLRESPLKMTPAAAESLEKAFALLDGRKHVKADREKFAMVGHSLGAVIVANLANQPGEHTFPAPKALMIVEPGDSRPPGFQREMSAKRFPSIVQDYGQVPPDVLMLVLAGDEDWVVGAKTAVHIFKTASQVGKENKDFILLRSDRHGEPALIADHFSPAARIEGDRSFRDRRLRRFRTRAEKLKESTGVNALDTRGYWRFLGALTDAAFYGKRREMALGGTPQQKDMGRWSDGTPVKPPIVTDRP